VLSGGLPLTPVLVASRRAPRGQVRPERVPVERTRIEGLVVQGTQAGRAGATMTWRPTPLVTLAPSVPLGFCHLDMYASATGSSASSASRIVS